MRADLTPYLCNIFWHSLSGPQARFAASAPGDQVRRYVRGFSPIVAFRDPDAPDFVGLSALCTPGEAVYCEGWAGQPPSDWRILHENTMFKMVWSGAAITSAAPTGVVPLDAAHASAALALAELTHPGPFGLRTIELGEFFGVFDEHGRLLAMAGERCEAGGYREISGVCTHPELQGQGWARRLVSLLIQRQQARGHTPFLHVMCDNTRAHELYLRMGFRDDQISTVRVVAHAPT